MAGLAGEPFYCGQRVGNVPNLLNHEAAQAPAAATAAVATLNADSERGWLITVVRWSYSAAPTGGALTITCGSISEVYAITGAGPGSLVINQRYPINTAVTITLASGAGSVVGTVYPSAGLSN